MSFLNNLKLSKSVYEEFPSGTDWEIKDNSSPLKKSVTSYYAISELIRVYLNLLNSMGEEELVPKVTIKQPQYSIHFTNKNWIELTSMDGTNYAVEKKYLAIYKMLGQLDPDDYNIQIQLTYDDKKTVTIEKKHLEMFKIISLIESDWLNH